LSFTRAREVDEDSAHHFRGDREEELRRHRDAENTRSRFVSLCLCVENLRIPRVDETSTRDPDGLTARAPV
jgi:hypothetical protein